MQYLVPDASSIINLAIIPNFLTILNSENYALSVSENMWDRLMKELDNTKDYELISILQAIAESQEHFQFSRLHSDSVARFYSSYKGNISLNTSNLCLTAQSLNGTVVTDSVPTFRELKCLHACINFRSGLSLAAEHIDDDQVKSYIIKTAEYFMPTVSHPESSWWYGKL